MITGIRWVFISACLLVSAPIASAQWKAVEKVTTYSISGKSGAELYEQIGQKGPEAGGNIRAIAHTSFVLTWTRKYEPQNGRCTIVTARPKLTIIYTLPKASGGMSTAVQASWTTFIDGVRKHELVHGDFIRELVKGIEEQSLGLSVDNDPDCKLIRVELNRRLGDLSQAQRQKSRDFDIKELSPGGNVHQLILNLVNGP